MPSSSTDKEFPETDPARSDHSGKGPEGEGENYLKQTSSDIDDGKNAVDEFLNAAGLNGVADELEVGDPVILPGKRQHEEDINWHLKEVNGDKVTVQNKSGETREVHQDLIAAKIKNPFNQEVNMTEELSTNDRSPNGEPKPDTPVSREDGSAEKGHQAEEGKRQLSRSQVKQFLSENLPNNPSNEEINKVYRQIWDRAKNKEK